VYWARGRDRRYVGQVPGLEPATGQPVVEEAVPVLHGSPTVVEFAPPDGIRPGQCGALLDESADILDVTATTVDLAVRGYLRIDEKPREHWWSHKDWTLTRLKEPDEHLADYESRLMKGLFRSGAVVELSDLHNTFYQDLAAVQDKIYAGAVAAKWFRRRPDRVREVWTLIGIGVIAAGVALTVVLFLHTHVAVAGLAVTAGGIVLLAMRGTMPARTAKGSAMLARVRGFRRYLDTAEAEQLRFEEQADVFARYLPYAVVFGLTDRWARVFAVLAAEDPELASSVGWYGGQSGWNVGQLSGSLSHFMSSASGTFTSHPSSSGGSGFSGGSSGGGGGGGGGGSW
jgi:uncharacterized membrane protein YgcG